MGKKLLHEIICVVLFFVIVLSNTGLTLANTVLLNTNFNSLGDVQNPLEGPLGTTNLEAGDFIAARDGNGANFSADTDYLLYPTDTILIEDGAIPKSRVIDFWYKPNYNQDDDTRDHNILGSSDNTFYLKHRNSNKSVMLYILTRSLAPSFAYAVKNSINWEAGDWVHFQIYWYSIQITVPDPATIIIPKLLINGEEADLTGNGTYSGLVSPGDNLFVGNKDNASSLSADGVVDDLFIYDKFWSPTISAVSPSTLDQGDQITISGSDFGPSESSTVTIGGYEANIISWSDTQIKAVVPLSDSGTKDVFVRTWGLVNSNTKTIVVGQAPAVTSLTVSNITSNSANINWTTSDNSKTKIQWGETESYGNSYSSASYLKNHSFSLTNLNSSTRYYFKIYVEDEYGDTGSTGGYSFITDSSNLIINPGSPNEESISFIGAPDSVSSASISNISQEPTQGNEEKIDNPVVFGINDIRAVDSNNNEKTLKTDTGITFLEGDKFKFFGNTLPNKKVCLILSDGKDSRLCTISDDNGDWAIIASNIIPGDYKIWIEIPDSNASSEKYNVMILGATSSAENINNLKLVYIIVTIILLAVSGTFVYRKKIFKR